ncbi:MAG: polysaccharide deacetylase family protein [Bacteriovoracaceae bacterium]|jgi:peptidoglycan/xylan/chitin deacetylase (PgdA/CDA1 family)|nr:hypothetical protein [Halobacteriovoraceae bacterium]MDP7320047.1 polysaccharide deacetylase family protein [Bacteriovoracaceae bacterium]
MKNILTVALGCLICCNVWSNEQTKYANIYADSLIKQFDRSLEYFDGGLLENPFYAKILAARIYLETRNAVEKNGEFSLVEVLDSEAYAHVVKQIDLIAKNIKAYQARIKQSEIKNLIYPSSGANGNVTGNTFPYKVWSLTFDDGPRSQRTEKIVDNLYARSLKASFFMLTRKAKRYPKTVDYVLDANMELALHSYSHPDLSKASDKKLEYEISQAKDDLQKLTGKKLTLFRLPYGAGMRKTDLREKIAKDHLIHIFWNVDTLDWKDKDPVSIYQRTIKQMSRTPRKSGVILFHDIHAQTVIASEMVMDYLIEQNMTVCPVGVVILHLNTIPQDCLK